MESSSVRTTSPRVIGVACVLAGGALALFGLGPLDPPNGPITPTYKTLTEVEPRLPLNASTAPGDQTNLFRIEVPGSYYLTGNITGVSGKSGIYISSSRVTLDLNGFAVEGVDGALYGIHANGAHGITVRNGHVYNWRHGVQLQETLGCIVESISVRDTTEDGFKIGRGATVRDCTATNCSPGFDIFEDATLTSCTAAYGPTRGFNVFGGGCILSHCVASQVPTGFYIGGPAILNDCSSHDNSSFGFYLLDSSVLTDCIAYDNESSGFVVVARSRMTRCTSRSNLEGFYITEANSLVECTAAGNTSNGLRIIGNANTIERGTFHENGASGIYLFEGRGNSVEANLCTYNTQNGIAFNDTDNLAVRNRARGNVGANYSIIAGNDYGAILTNPGAGFASSNAWANFAY
jgi:parallel beta-helix repeat protein